MVTAATESTAKSKSKSKSKASEEGVGKEARISESEKKQLRKKTIDARDKIETSYFDFAELVYQVFDSAAYLDWVGEVYDAEEGTTVRKQYEDFEQYVESELAMSVRKANYFVSMVRWFRVEIGDQKVIDKVKGLGWSKVKELVGVCTSENVDEWVGKAKSMNVAQLAAACKTELQGEKGPKKTPDVCRRSFTLLDDQVKIVDEACQHASKVAESEKWGYVLTLICQDYLAGAVRPTKGTQKQAYIEKMEATLGVQVVAVDNETGKIIFGQELAEKLMSDEPFDGKATKADSADEDEDEDEDEGEDEDENDEDDDDGDEDDDEDDDEGDDEGDDEK